MESSWRQNVSDYGLGPGFIWDFPLSVGYVNLAARVLAGPGAGGILTDTRLSGDHLIVHLPTGPLLPYTISTIPGVPGKPHFPFGSIVEPDVHA